MGSAAAFLARFFPLFRLGAAVAAMPAFAAVRDAVLGIDGGPLVSLAVATNVLAALTSSASGGSHWTRWERPIWRAQPRSGLIRGFCIAWR